MMKRLSLSVLVLLFSLALMSQVERKVIVEHFTNSRCGTCAARNPAFFETLQDYPDVLHIAYHPSSPYSSCIFSQHNPEENDERTNFYGIYGGTPRAVIQGDVVPVQNPLVKPGQIDVHLGKSSDYRVLLTREHLGGDDYRVTITIERVSGSGTEEITLYAGLAEKEVQYSAPNGEELHPNVFRKVLKNESLSLSAGETATFTEDYATDEEWVEDEIYAFAILHPADEKLILQSASSLDSPTSADDRRTEHLGSVFYPNPVISFARISPQYENRFVSGALYTLTGNRVGMYEDPGRIDLQDQPPGMYLMVLTDANGGRYTTRILKTAK